jgi:acyl CoA:acetate/3-ketoacid CoA transferase beta subunit
MGGSENAASLAYAQLMPGASLEQVRASTSAKFANAWAAEREA